MSSSPTLTAEQVAALLGFKSNTIYRYRARSLAKLSRGMRLGASDFPTGTDPLDGPILWRADEIDRFRNNRKRSPRPAT